MAVQIGQDWRVPVDRHFAVIGSEKAVFDSIKSRLFGRAFSKQTAKNRLQMVLVQDRSGLTPNEMDLFRKDIIEVVSKYFMIEKKQIEIEWQRADSSTALIINTPVVGRKHQVQQQKVAAGS